MGLKNVLKNIVKHADKKGKKSSEVEQTPETEFESQEEPTIPGLAPTSDSGSPDGSEEEKPARGLVRQRSLNRRTRRMMIAEEVEANMQESAEDFSKPPSGAFRRRGRRGDNYGSDDNDSTGSVERKDQGGDDIGISNHSAGDRRSRSRGRARGSKGGVRSSSSDRLAQRTSSRERPTREANKERLEKRRTASRERIAAKRDSSRERLGRKRSESRERPRRGVSKDRGHRRGTSQDRLKTRRDMGLAHESTRALYSEKPIPHADETEAEASASNGSDGVEDKSGVMVGNGQQESKQHITGRRGKERDSSKRSTSRGRGRPDRNSHTHRSISNGDGKDQGRSDSRERRRSRDRSRDQRHRRTRQEQAPPTDESGEASPATSALDDNVQVSVATSAQAPVPGAQETLETPHYSDDNSQAHDRSQLNEGNENSSGGESQTSAPRPSKPEENSSLVEGLETTHEETTARQCPGVIFHTEEPQDEPEENKVVVESKPEETEANPALALLSMLTQQDTAPAVETSKSRHISPEARDQPERCQGDLASQSFEDVSNVEPEESPFNTETEETAHADKPEHGETQEDGITVPPETESEISLSNVRVTISMGTKQPKQEPEAVDAAENPALALLGHIGSNYKDLIDEKKNPCPSVEPASKSTNQFQSSVDFFRGTDANDSALNSSSHCPTGEEDTAKRASRTSRRKKVADESQAKGDSDARAPRSDRRLTRRQKASEVDETGVPPSSADERKARRVKRAERVKKEDSDLPPPSLAPPSLAGELPSGRRKVRRAKKKSDDDGAGEKSLAPPSLAGDVVASGGRSRRVRRTKSDSDVPLCDQNLNPPSLAGDQLYVRSKKNSDEDVSGGMEAQLDPKAEKLSRRQEKKAKRFNKLDDDDNDSLGGDVPATQESRRQPRRGMLMKAKSAVQVLERGTKVVAKKASSSRNLFA